MNKKLIFACLLVLVLTIGGVYEFLSSDNPRTLFAATMFVALAVVATLGSTFHGVFALTGGTVIFYAGGDYAGMVGLLFFIGVLATATVMIALYRKDKDWPCLFFHCWFMDLLGEEE